MEIERFAAFSDGGVGGNPAGVVLLEKMPAATHMQRIAAEVGYSETAFAVPHAEGWRVRYFSPESEVPFCGHATIALGAALAIRHGDNVFELELNHTAITVEGRCDGNVMRAALQSPTTSSRAADDELLLQALELFGLRKDDLDERIAPAVAAAGATHLIIATKDRESLAKMQYTLREGAKLMKTAGLETINLVYAETSRRFHSRNAFASGGVYEDPATGAAAAALAGHLRDLDWPHGGRIVVVQGEDMGMRSLIEVEFSDEPGSSVRVSGAVRRL